MKTIHIIIAVTLIYMIKSSVDGFPQYNCTDYAPTSDTNTIFNVDGKGEPAFSLGFCKSTYLEDGYAKCCFLKYKDESKRKYHCYPVTPLELSDIDDQLVKSLKSNYDDVSLDCNSRYLLTPLILVAALLLI